MNNTWKKWQNIEDPTNYRGPSIYKVRLISVNGKPYQLPRLLKTDKEGIMCMGQTSNMERRRKQFITAIQNGYGHSSLNLVYTLNDHTDFRSKFKKSVFQFCFRKCKSTKQSEKSECGIMGSYFKKFGEVPPLNSVRPRNHFD